MPTDEKRLSSDACRNLAATARLKSKPTIDIAILDPFNWNKQIDDDGWQESWVEKLKRDYPTIGFVFITDSDDASEREAYLRGAHHCLTENAKTQLELITSTIQLLAVDRAIQHIAQDMTSYLPDILTRICQYVVQIFNVDHSGLVVFKADYSSGEAVAEYPPRGNDISQQRPFGSIIPVRNSRTELNLIYNKRSIPILDIASDEDLGPVRPILADIFLLRSILIVPIVSRNNQVIASISLDIDQSNTSFHQFEGHVITLCERLAKHSAIAVENFLLQRAVKKLGSIIMLPMSDRPRLSDQLKLIVAEAVEFLRAKSGGVYLYDDEQKLLTVVMDLLHPESIGKVLKKGKGMAGHLVETGENVAITADYNHEKNKSSIYRDEFEAVIETRLIWQGEPKGVLYVNDEIGRVFTEEEGEQLLMFSTQAASMIEQFYQRRKLHVTNEIMKQISVHVEMKDVLTAIVSEIAQHVHSSHCSFFMPEKEAGNEFLVPKASCGLVAHRIMTRKFSTSDGSGGLVARVYRERKPLLTGDAKHEPEFVAARENTDKDRSMILVPVVTGDRCLGVISVDQDYLNAFTRYDLELVSAIAVQIGAVIDRSNTLLLHREIAERIVSRDDSEHVLEQIVVDAMSLTRSTSGIIYRLKEEAGKLTIVDSFPYPFDFVHPPARLEYEGSVTRRVYKSQTMEVIANIEENDPRVNPELYQKGVRSMVAVPIMREREALGVLFLNSSTQHDLTPLQKFSLTSLAGLAAVALRNTDLYTAREKGRQQLKSLYEASEMLTVLSDPEAILNTVARLACEAAKAKSVRIVRFEERDDKLVAVNPPYAYGVPTDRSSEDVVRENGLSVEVLLTGKYLAIPNVDEAPAGRINESMIKDGVRAALCLPLSNQEKAKRIGVMWIQYELPQDFSSNYEVWALQLYASQAAFAYDNAKRMHELEEDLSTVTESFASDIKSDYDQARLQAKNNFQISSFIVFVASYFVWLGAFVEIILPNRGGLAIAIVAAVTQMTTQLVFNRIDKANARMDQYHKELYNVRLFEQLMAATDDLDEGKEEEKKQIIKTARDQWLKH